MEDQQLRSMEGFRPSVVVQDRVFQLGRRRQTDESGEASSLLGMATSVWIWNRVMEIQERVGPAVAGELIVPQLTESVARCFGARVASKCE